LTHYLVAVHFCETPPWIDEGLSQVLASGPPFPHLAEDELVSARRQATRSKERGCLRLLQIPSGEKLSKSQYRVACALTFYLLTRSGQAAASNLIRFLEATRPDAPPEQTFFDCWAITMKEACRAVASSADSDIGTWGQGSGIGDERNRRKMQIRPRPRTEQKGFRLGSRTEFDTAAPGVR
jgi:hypothetical protein